MGKEEVAPDFIPDEAPDFIPDPQAGGSPAFAKPHADLMGPTDSKAAPVGDVSLPDAIRRTAANAVTLGHGGEASGALDTLLSRIPPSIYAPAARDPALPPLDSSVSYRQRRNAFDALERAGSEQHPIGTGLTEVAGAVMGAKAIGAALTALGAPAAGATVAAPSTIPRAVAVGAGLGAGRAAGNAQELEDVPGALPGGAAVGAVGGLVGGVTSKLAEKAVPTQSFGEAVRGVAKSVSSAAKGAIGGQAAKVLLEGAGVDPKVARLVGNSMSLVAIGSAGKGNSNVTKAAIGEVARFLSKRPDLVELVVQRIGEKGAAMVAEQISSK